MILGQCAKEQNLKCHLVHIVEEHTGTRKEIYGKGVLVEQAVLDRCYPFAQRGLVKLPPEL